MGKWLRRTFDYGNKGKVVVIFDDSKPLRVIRKVIVTDADGTQREFDRDKGELIVREKGKDPITHKGDPVQPHKKSFTFPFPKADEEIDIDDNGKITWRKKVSDKDKKTSEEIVTKGKKGQGDWTRPDGSVDKPEKTTDEDIDEPKPDKPDKPAGGSKPSGGKPKKKASKPKKRRPR
jgi:hypothetical protein